jgi:hypothetical protein
MTSRLLVMGLLLSSSFAVAAKNAKVTEAILLYDKTEFAKAKDRLVTLVDLPTLTEEDRVAALTYLAASYHAVGDVSSAKAQLLRLARAYPTARVDPGLFLPELVALADEARGEVAREEPQAKPDDKVAGGEVKPGAGPGAALRVTSPPLVYSFIPFGVGQFKNGDTGKGVLFLTAEVLTLGTCVVTLTMFESSKVSGRFLREGVFTDPAAAATLQTLYLATFWTGLAVVVGGMVEAIASRPIEVAAMSVRVLPNGVAVRF